MFLFAVVNAVVAAALSEASTASCTALTMFFILVL